MVEPRVFHDVRGAFSQSYHREQYAEIGIQDEFMQDNVVSSTGSVLRGLHYQFPFTQAKLIYAIRGRILDVVVDLRHGEPTFGHSFAVELDDLTRRQLYVPKGFAHGYCTLTDDTVVAYKCGDLYHPECERGLRWDDPCVFDLWPKREFAIADKDLDLPGLRDFTPLDFGG